MTDGAQQALRRTMELWSNTTRFALACNNSDKIIEAIQSRCAMLRYGKLSDQEIMTQMLKVCKSEGVMEIWNMHFVLNVLILNHKLLCIYYLYLLSGIVQCRWFGSCCIYCSR